MNIESEVDKEKDIVLSLKKQFSSLRDVLMINGLCGEKEDVVSITETEGRVKLLIPCIVGSFLVLPPDKGVLSIESRNIVHLVTRRDTIERRLNLL